MNIYVTIKNKYGNDLIYPACEKALQFASLIGQKTFTRGDLEKIKGLGYEIQFKAQELAI